MDGGGAGEGNVPKGKREDLKVAQLRAEGALHPRPEKVAAPLFAGGEFFDRRDAVQVKYEMLRQARVDGEPVSRCASAFGWSRQSFYQAQAAFARAGLPGLMPCKRGPRGAHKLTAEVMAFAVECRQADRSLTPAELAARIRERFDVTVHPRTVQRALRREKGGP
jgi:transposase